MVHAPPDSLAQQLNDYRAYILAETESVKIKGVLVPVGLALLLGGAGLLLQRWRGTTDARRP